jgi:hypothetical protein
MGRAALRRDWLSRWCGGSREIGTRGSQRPAQAEWVRDRLADTGL